MYVLVHVHRGIISDVSFFEDGKEANLALAKTVREMNAQEDDAAVFTESGLYQNSNAFLDEWGNYIGP